jgi:hypothetical protein
MARIGGDMAQINCPKCSNKVKVGSTNCPNCGTVFKKYQETVLNHKKEVEEYYEQERQKQRQEKLKKLKRCDACDSTISKRALSCPRCGDPQGKAKEQVAASSHSVKDILDFTFKTFITPLLVKIIYGVSSISILLLLTGGIVHSIGASSIGYAVGQIVGILIFNILLILTIRVFCEGALLLLKIEENTRK